MNAIGLVNFVLISSEGIERYLRPIFVVYFDVLSDTIPRKNFLYIVNLSFIFEVRTIYRFGVVGVNISGKPKK